MKEFRYYIKAAVCSLAAILFIATAGCGSREKTPEGVPTDAGAAPTARPGTSAPETTGQAPSVSSEDIFVMFVNVGKADATVIRTGDRFYIVDTGTKESVPQLIGALRYLGAEKIDGVFLTHTHDDHTGGLSALLEFYPVAGIYRSEISLPKDGKENPIDKAAAKAGKTVGLLHAGDLLTLGNGCECRILGPLELNTDDDNDNSLVLDLSVNGRSVLLAGDMQFPEEESLLNAGVIRKTDVLRVGNHGNPDATGEAFAAAADPEIAVISTDRSVDTDSANPRVLSLLQNADVRITDTSGIGFLLTVTGLGEMRMEDVRISSGADLLIEQVDTDAQTATIRNRGKDTDLSGFMLLSLKGKELFVFPDGASLPSGASCTVAAEGGEGDYLWRGETKPWNRKKDDAALLFDRYGNLLSRLD